jgi:hypothetical protein
MPESDEGIQPNPGDGCKPRLLPDTTLTIPVMLSSSKHLCRLASDGEGWTEETQSGRVTGEPAEKLLREMRAKHS